MFKDALAEPSRGAHRRRPFQCISAHSSHQELMVVVQVLHSISTNFQFRRNFQVRLCSTFETFKSIALSRCSVQSFLPDPIPESEIEQLIEVTTSSPSSFNLQPYKIILIRDEATRKMLGEHAMLGNNKRKVVEAPLTVAFVACRGFCHLARRDLILITFSPGDCSTDPSGLVEDIALLERDRGASDQYIRTLRSQIFFLFDRKGLLARKLRQTVSYFMSPLMAVPNLPSSLDAWAATNTALAAQTFMLAATAKGLSTAPMEGFDEMRLCSILGVPMETHFVPLIVSTGYPHPQHIPKPKVRYKITDICYSNKYGSPISKSNPELN